MYILINFSIKEDTYSIIDTDDGVVEDYTYSQLCDIIDKGIKIAGFYKDFKMQGGYDLKTTPLRNKINNKVGIKFWGYSGLPLEMSNRRSIDFYYKYINCSGISKLAIFFYSSCFMYNSSSSPEFLINIYYQFLNKNQSLIFKNYIDTVNYWNNSVGNYIFNHTNFLVYTYNDFIYISDGIFVVAVPIKLFDNSTRIKLKSNTKPKKESRKNIKKSNFDMLAYSERCYRMSLDSSDINYIISKYLDISCIDLSSIDDIEVYNNTLLSSLIQLLPNDFKVIFSKFYLSNNIFIYWFIRGLFNCKVTFKTLLYIIIILQGNNLDNSLIQFKKGFINSLVTMCNIYSYFGTIQGEPGNYYIKINDVELVTYSNTREFTNSFYVINDLIKLLKHIDDLGVDYLIISGTPRGNVRQILGKEVKFYIYIPDVLDRFKISGILNLNLKNLAYYMVVVVNTGYNLRFINFKETCTIMDLNLSSLKVDLNKSIKKSKKKHTSKLTFKDLDTLKMLYKIFDIETV